MSPSFFIVPVVDAGTQSHKGGRTASSECKDVAGRIIESLFGISLLRLFVLLE